MGNLTPSSAVDRLAYPHAQLYVEGGCSWMHPEYVPHTVRGAAAAP